MLSMNKYNNLILLLLVLCLSSCIFEYVEIYHINKSKEDVLIACSAYGGELSTRNGSNFELLASGDTLIRSYDMEVEAIWQVVVIKKSTYEYFSEDYLSQHDVYDMRKAYSRSGLKQIGYKIVITDYDLSIPKNDEHDN